MTEELPPLVFLDMATKAAGYSCDWASYEAAKLTAARDGIIAHARTFERLAKHEPDIVPVDEDALPLFLILCHSHETLNLDEMKAQPWWAETLAQFKAELAGRK